MFSLICAWINGWVNNREACDLRRHRAHYGVTVILISVSMFVEKLKLSTKPIEKDAHKDCSINSWCNSPLILTRDDSDRTLRNIQIHLIILHHGQIAKIQACWTSMNMTLIYMSQGDIIDDTRITRKLNFHPHFRKTDFQQLLSNSWRKLQFLIVLYKG